MITDFLPLRTQSLTLQSTFYTYISSQSLLFKIFFINMITVFGKLKKNWQNWRVFEGVWWSSIIQGLVNVIFSPHTLGPNISNLYGFGNVTWNAHINILFSWMIKKYMRPLFVFCKNLYISLIYVKFYFDKEALSLYIEINANEKKKIVFGKVINKTFFQMILVTRLVNIAYLCVNV